MKFKKQNKSIMYLEIGTTEKTALPERLELASEIIKSFGTAGLENTMTTFNGNKKKEKCYHVSFSIQIIIITVF
jgi:hypothetical protein